MKNPTPLVFAFQTSFLRPLCLVAVLLFGAALPGWAADSSWDEEAGGDFDTGGNWTAGVPGAGDIATFALNETYTVEFGSATTSNLRAVVSNGTVTWDLDGNTYALTAAGSNSTGTVSEALVVQGASGQSANLVITGGGTLEVLDTTLNFNARIGFINGGSGSVTVDDATWDQIGTINMGSSTGTAALTVRNGGVVTLDGALSLRASSSNTVTVTGEGSVLDVSSLAPLAGGNNTVLIEDGAQLLVSGNTSVPSGTTMTVTGSDTVWNGDTASRTVGVSGGVFTITDGATSNIRFSSVSGLATVSGGASMGTTLNDLGMQGTDEAILTVTGAGSTVTVRDLRLRGNDSNTDNDIRVLVSDGGTFDARNLFGSNAGRFGSEFVVTGTNASATFSGSFNIGVDDNSSQTATVSDGGSLTVVSNLAIGDGGIAVLDVDGGTITASVVNLGLDATGEGTLTIADGTLTHSGLFTIGGAGVGVFTASNGSSITSNDNVRIGHNAGSSGSATISGSTSSWTVEDSTLTVGGAGTGILTLEEGAVVTADAVVIGAAGTLAGDGFIFSPTVTNAGLVSPGNSTAILYVSGNYIQEATGTLEIGIGGTTPGSGHDQLSNFIFGTTATLEGTLTLLAVDNFMPSIGDSFLILDFVASGGSIVGEFDTINAFTLSGSRFWDFDNLYTTGTVSVIPEPATVAFLLGALALAGVVWRRRRLGNA